MAGSILDHSWHASFVMTNSLCDDKLPGQLAQPSLGVRHHEAGKAGVVQDGTSP